ncbi:hypothetical protein PFISCL1PPCAC_2198, partial [Pristionchus fissidentatus]
ISSDNFLHSTTMNRPLLFIFFSLSIISAVPLLKTNGILPDDFCSQCVDFLTNPSTQNTVFTQMCSNLMHSSDKNPMVKVCTAGFLGEMQYVKERTAGNTNEEVCQWLGCNLQTTTPL